jgi:glycosyltransferase involved in cell wall biosynthesis
LLTSEFLEIQLFMAGPDKRDGTYPAARAPARPRRVKRHGKFTGPIAKVSVVAAVDRGGVFLNTSEVDNHPFTLLERMACGAAVVTTLAGGVPYIAQDGVNYLPAAVGDAARLAVAAGWGLLARRRGQKISYPEKGIQI